MFDDLDAAAGRLSAVRISELPDALLMDGVLCVERVRRWLDAFETSALGELDARGSTDVSDGLSTKVWLSRDAGVSMRTAAQRVDVARTVRADLGHTAAAMAAGRVGFDHAKVLADAVNPRIVDEFVQLEPELIEMSSHMTFERWRAHVRAVAALLDQDGGYDPDADIYANRLRLSATPDGTDVSGRLVGDARITVTGVLDQVTDELYRQYAHDADVSGGALEIPGRDTLRALALAEVCRRAMGIDLASTRPPRVEATLVVHADDLETVYDADGVPHRVGSLGAITCDMDIHTVILNSLGVPLDMGRAVRTANRAQRRALARRDGGCVFPGCCAPVSHTDVHHVIHWILGGTTDVATMALLCRRHHGVVHRAGWGMGIGDDGWCWVTMPGGRWMWGQQHGVQRAGPAPPSILAA